ncbi:unnamed protein product [Allacma fusca]|uniref:Uncharacterized protein n=1 Tax=Allacma fusca TaxID=39272 RepID=A0A8J2JQM2_9HEXA|nr:unnamed protein product [Allacma fusca]
MARLLRTFSPLIEGFVTHIWKSAWSRREHLAKTIVPFVKGCREYVPDKNYPSILSILPSFGTTSSVLSNSSPSSTSATVKFCPKLQSLLDHVLMNLLRNPRLYWTSLSLSRSQGFTTGKFPFAARIVSNNKIHRSRLFLTFSCLFQIQHHSFSPKSFLHTKLRLQLWIIALMHSQEYDVGRRHARTNTTHTPDLLPDDD